MAGPRIVMNPGYSGVRVREAEFVGAPLRVSDHTKPRNTVTPKSSRNFQRTPQSHAPEADRPSTSGGISTRKPMERQGTKDDLHVGPFRANQFQTTYYNFPLPGSLPTPAAISKPSASQTYSPEILEPEFDPHREIGMALGSPIHQAPSHPAAISNPQVQFQAPVRNYSPESLEEWQNPTISAKRKASKWKKWGGLFGRKSSDSSVDYSRAQSEVQTMHEADYMTFPDPPAEKTRGRARTNSERKNFNHKPDIQRENRVPVDFPFQETKPLPKGPKESSVFTEKRPPEIKLEGGPLLKVDIPTIEMERYSIMFGSVIKSTSSASSLLARRQATLDKLKVVNEAIAQYERQEAQTKSKLLRPRRATSPQPTRSPSMSLFPVPSRTQQEGMSHIPYRASPLHRSNTSPAALSPNRQSFGPLRPNEEEHTIMLAPSPTVQPAATLTRPRSACGSFMALDSPTSSIVSIEEVHDNVPLKPHLTEPKWEMISPPTVQEDPMKVKPLKLTPKPDSKVQLPRKKSLQSSLDVLARARAKEEAEELIRTAADISIARQISISKRQRQLLVPAKSRIANAGRVVVSEETSSGTERLLVNEKPLMMPRLVNVRAERMVKSEVAELDRA